MQTDEMSPAGVWPTFLGEEFGCTIQLTLSVLAQLPRDRLLETIDKAVDGIEREVSLGPLLNPSGYLDGRRFDNADQYVRILAALRSLVGQLPEFPCKSNSAASE